MDLREVEVLDDEVTEGIEQRAVVGGEHGDIRAAEADGPARGQIGLCLDVELEIQPGGREDVAQEVADVRLALEGVLQMSSVAQVDMSVGRL